MLLLAKQRPQLRSPRLWFGERDVLASYEPPARRLVDGPRQVRRGEHEDPVGVAFVLGCGCGCSASGAAPRPRARALAPGGGPLQVAPLNQELGLDPAGGLVLAGTGALGQQGVDLVDEDNAGGHELG